MKTAHTEPQDSVRYSRFTPNYRLAAPVAFAALALAATTPEIFARTFFNNTLGDNDFNNAANWTALGGAPLNGGLPGETNTINASAILQSGLTATTTADYTVANGAPITYDWGLVPRGGDTVNINHNLSTSTTDGNTGYIHIGYNDGATATINQATATTVTTGSVSMGDAGDAANTRFYNLNGTLDSTTITILDGSKLQIGATGVVDHLSDGLAGTGTITINSSQQGSITSTGNGGVIYDAVSLSSSSADFRQTVGDSALTFSGGISSAADASLSLNLEAILDSTVNLNNGTLTFTSNGDNKDNATQLNVTGNDWGLARLNFGGYVLAGADNALVADAGVEFGWSSAGNSNATLDLNGFDQAVSYIAQTGISLGQGGDSKITDTSGSGSTLSLNHSSDHEYQGRFEGGVGLSKDGTGTLTLNNLSGTASSNTGNTLITDGTLRIESDGALGTGTITVDNVNTTAALVVADGVTIAQDLTVKGNGGGTVKLDSDGAGTAIFTGSVTFDTFNRIGGSGTLQFDGAVSSTNSTQLFVADAVFNDTLDLTGFDIWQHVSNTTFNNTGNSWNNIQVAFGGSVTVGVDNALDTDGGVRLGWTNAGNGTASLNLGGFSQQVGYIETVTIDAGADQNITGGGTLTVNQTSGTREYQGRITDGATATSIVKSGAGTLILDNRTGAASSYSGTTSVSAGTLALQDAATNNAIANSTVIDVASGAILDVSGITNGFVLANGQTITGTGSVVGGTTVGAGATLSPGNSPGTQTFDNLTWVNGGTYLWEINADTPSGGTQGADPGWDWINVTNTFDLSGITNPDGFTIDITSLTSGNTPGLASGFDITGKTYGDAFESFTILSFGSLTGDFDSNEFKLETGNFENKVGWSLELVGTDLVLNAVFVPEPSSTALLGLGLSSLLLRRKRS